MPSSPQNLAKCDVARQGATQRDVLGGLINMNASQYTHINITKPIEKYRLNREIIDGRNTLTAHSPP
jgi:hypothetical protein